MTTTEQTYSLPEQTREALTAHRYVDAREIEPGTIVVDPDLGRVEFISWREAPANPSRGAITVCGTRNGREVEFVVLPARFYNFPRVCVEGEFSEREVEQVTSYAEGLMSGRCFHNAAASHRSITGYQPPAATREYAASITALGKLAAQGDRFAYLVAKVLPVMAPAGVPGNVAAMVYSKAAEVLASGWFDTIGNAGPEAGRRSSHEKTYSLADRLIVSAALHEVATAHQVAHGGLGWCEDALRRALHLR